MRYRNTKTQAVIETACAISGGDWIMEEQPKKTKKPMAKNTTRKKSGDKNE